MNKMTMEKWNEKPKVKRRLKREVIYTIIFILVISIIIILTQNAQLKNKNLCLEMGGEYSTKNTKEDTFQYCTINNELYTMHGLKRAIKNLEDSKK